MEAGEPEIAANRGFVLLREIEAQEDLTVAVGWELGKNLSNDPSLLFPKQELERVRPLARELRQQGWTFAC